MNDKFGPRVAWTFALLAVLASFFTAAFAAGRIRVQTPLAALESRGGKGTLGPGDHTLSLLSGGQTRTFLVHVPTGYQAGAKPLPLVFMLHGAGGSGKQVVFQTGWDKKADKENFLAVFPDALPARPDRPAAFRGNPRFWRDGSGRGAKIGGAKIGGAESADIDDVGFITSVLDTMEKRFSVDTKRVYVTGFSSGASMTFRLVHSLLSRRIAAAAPVSGHAWTKPVPKERPLSLLLIWGNADPINPVAGGGRDFMPKPSLQAEIAAYAKAINAPARPAPIPDIKGINRYSYQSDTSEALFLVTTIDGAGHVWPGGREVLPPSVVGPTTRKLNATDTIWYFFSKQFLAPRLVKP